MADPYDVVEPEKPVAPRPERPAAPPPSARAATAAADGSAESGVIDTSKPLVEPGFPGIRLLMVLGGVLLLLAVVMAASAAHGERSHLGYALGKGFLTLFNGLLHTGTGVVAIIASAFFMKRKVGSIELAAGRMFVAFGVLLLVTAPVFPLGWLGWGLKWALGLGAYWLAVRLLFRKSLDETNIIAVAHLVLYLLYQVGVWTNQYLALLEQPAAPAAAPTTAAAAKAGLILLGVPI